MTENNEVATAQSQAVAMPDYLQGFANTGVGMPEIDMKELRVPMLKMVQLQGEAFDTTKDNFGNIYDNISLEDLGTSIDIVVVDFNPSWIKWSSERKMIGFSTDGINWTKGEYAGQTLAQTEGDDAFKCKHYNFYVLLLDNGVPRKLPYRISLSGMSAKVGDRIYQIISTKAIAAGYPMFSFIFNLTTTREKGEKGAYSIFRVEQKKEMVSKEVAQIAVDMITTIKSKDTKIVVKEEETVAPKTTEAPAPLPEKKTGDESVKKDPVW